MNHVVSCHAFPFDAFKTVQCQAVSWRTKMVEVNENIGLEPFSGAAHGAIYSVI